MDTTVRRADRSDLDAVMALLRLKAEFDNALDKFVAGPEQLAKDLMDTSDRGGILLVEQGGEPIGIATYFFTYSSFLARPGVWLDDLYVVEQHRKAGAGHALMASLAQLAKGRGCARIEWIVNAANEPAIRFYEGQGAVLLESARMCRMTSDAIDRLAGADD